jgi:hypothetical protein
MDLTTNGVVITDALKFVNGKTEKLIRDSSPSPKQLEEEIIDTEIASDTDADIETEGVF